MSAAVGTSDDLSHEVIDRGGITAQQLLVVGLCMFFNMLDGFDITAMAVASALGMVVFGMAPSQLNLLLLLTLLIGILQQGAFTGLYAAAAKAYPTNIRSTGIGWSIGLGRFGAVVGPAVAGYLIAAGLDMSANYFVFAVPMVIGGFIAYRLHIR